MIKPETAASFGFGVNRAAYVIRQSLWEAFRAHGWRTTPEEWGLLSRLDRRDGQHPAELAEDMVRDPTTITRLVDALAREELVRRETDPADRRRVCIWLTDAGRALAAKLQPLAAGVYEASVADIPPEELKVARRVLGAVRSNLVGRMATKPWEKRKRPEQGGNHAA